MYTTTNGDDDGVGFTLLLLPARCRWCVDHTADKGTNAEEMDTNKMQDTRNSCVLLIIKKMRNHLKVTTNVTKLVVSSSLEKYLVARYYVFIYCLVTVNPPDGYSTRVPQVSFALLTHQLWRANFKHID
jgi:hypothetical protein